METILIISGILAVIVVVGALGHHFDKKRREAIQAVAEQMRMTYMQDGSPMLGAGFAALPLFNLGRSRKARNLLHGMIEDIEALAFDYQYTTGSGKNQSTTNCSVVAMRLAGSALPDFTLYPEHLLHRIAGMLGFPDINLLEHPVFSKMFQLKGPDPDAIRARFGPAVVAWCEARKGVSIQAGGEWVVVFRENRRPKPAEIPGCIAEAMEIRGLLG